MRSYYCFNNLNIERFNRFKLFNNLLGFLEHFNFSEEISEN